MPGHILLASLLLIGGLPGCEFQGGVVQGRCVAFNAKDRTVTIVADTTLDQPNPHYETGNPLHERIQNQHFPAVDGGFAAMNSYRQAPCSGIIRILANLIMIGAVFIAMFMALGVHAWPAEAVFWAVFFGITIPAWTAAFLLPGYLQSPPPGENGLPAG